LHKRIDHVVAVAFGIWLSIKLQIKIKTTSSIWQSIQTAISLKNGNNAQLLC